MVCPAGHRARLEPCCPHPPDREQAVHAAGQRAHKLLADLRHKDDQPTIGIILCKGRNEVIVEYALRDSSKPMGVAQYRLSPALPPQLQQALPTAEEFAREFPLMSVVKLRIEIERLLSDILCDSGPALKAPAGIGNMLRELHQRGLAPASTERFLESLRVMNEAVHGLDVDPVSAEQAVEIGTAFLAELRGMQR